MKFARYKRLLLMFIIIIVIIKGATSPFVYFDKIG